MILNYGQEEATSELCFIREVVSCTRSRYNDLHFLDSEGCLSKVRAVLSKNDLLLIKVFFCYVIHWVRYYRIVFFTRRNISLVCESGAWSDHNVAWVSRPANVYTVQSHVLITSCQYLEGVFRGHFALDETFLAPDHKLSLDRALAHAIDIASFFDLEGVCDGSFSVAEMDHVNESTYLANNKHIILDVHQRRDVRSLGCYLSNFLKVFRFVDKRHSTVACKRHPLGSLRDDNLVDTEAFVDEHAHQLVVLGAEHTYLTDRWTHEDMFMADRSHVVNLSAHLSKRDLLSLRDHWLIRHSRSTLRRRCIALLIHLSCLWLQNIKEVPNSVTSYVRWQVRNQSANTFLHKPKHRSCCLSLHMNRGRTWSVHEVTIKLLKAGQEVFLDLTVGLWCCVEVRVLS